MLVDAIEQEAYALIHSACRQKRAEVHALGGTADHVHLLVTVPRTILIPDFMELVKGVLSKALNDTHGTPHWSFKWQGGYGIATVCAGHLRHIQNYVQNQKRRHAAGTLWPSGEPPDSAS